MAGVYYQIFQAAKRIVDEEKKAQSHLLLTSRMSTASGPHPVGSSDQNPPSGSAVPAEMAVRLDHPPGGVGSSTVICHSQGQNGRPVWPDVCSSAASASSTRSGRPSLDIPRCPRRRYSSTTSTEIHDTSLSLNSITAQQQQALLCHHHHHHHNHHRNSTATSGGHSGAIGRSSVASTHQKVRLRFALNKERKVITLIIYSSLNQPRFRP